MKVKSRGNNIHLYVGAITVDLGDDPLEVVDLARRLLGKAIRVQRQAATCSAEPDPIARRLDPVATAATCSAEPDEDRNESELQDGSHALRWL
jgi:hypothetical protein